MLGTAVAEGLVLLDGLSLDARLNALERVKCQENTHEELERERKIQGELDAALETLKGFFISEKWGYFSRFLETGNIALHLCEGDFHEYYNDEGNTHRGSSVGTDGYYSSWYDGTCTDECHRTEIFITKSGLLVEQQKLKEVSYNNYQVVGEIIQTDDIRECFVRYLRDCCGFNTVIGERGDYEYRLGYRWRSKDTFMDAIRTLTNKIEKRIEDTVEALNNREKPWFIKSL